MKNKPQQLNLPYLPSLAAPRRDTRVQMAMYLLGSPVLRDFAKPLGVHVYNVGITLERYLDQKVVEKGLRAYGSIVATTEDRNKEITVHPQGTEWRLVRLPNPAGDLKTARMLAQLPDGAYRDGVILFRLPHHIHIDGVERQFHRLLAARNLNAFLESVTGQERLANAALPAGARLFTDYQEMNGTRRSLASEFYLVRPKHDLLELMEALILAMYAKGRSFGG